MEYGKPELAVLGEADRVIQGSKNAPQEDGDDSAQSPPTFELED